MQLKMQAAIRNISLSEFDFEQQVTYLKLKKKILNPTDFWHVQDGSFLRRSIKLWLVDSQTNKPAP
jgi:hypothetical protein